MAEPFVPVCDFCSTPWPPWSYPARTFALACNPQASRGVTSIGGWAACDRCHELIESGRRAELLAHSVETLLAAAPVLRSHADDVRMTTAALHVLFFSERSGDAVYRPGATRDPTVD